jgi:hypothetical protein
MFDAVSGSIGSETLSKAMDPSQLDSYGVLGWKQEGGGRWPNAVITLPPAQATCSNYLLPV